MTGYMSRSDGTDFLRLDAQTVCLYRVTSGEGRATGWRRLGDALEPDGEVGEVGSERGGDGGDGRRERIVGEEGVEGSAGAGHGGVEGTVAVERLSQSG